MLENIVTYKLVSFFKDTFNLYYEVEDFRNNNFKPFFNADHYKDFDIFIVSFPVKRSIECAEVRIRLKNISYVLKDTHDIEINFKNIVFDYNKHFENEVVSINNMSVEEVFENESLFC